MRKEKLRMSGILVGAICLLISGTAGAADYCTPAPTCESLGFTKVASDCTGQDTLKCPFDNSKLYCYKKADVKKIYAPGDIYLNDNGLAVGIVLQKVGEDNGLVVSMRSASVTFSDETRNDPFNFCNNVLDGGLIWTLPTSGQYGLINSLPVEIRKRADVQGLVSSGNTHAIVGMTIDSSYTPSSSTIHHRWNDALYIYWSGATGSNPTISTSTNYNAKSVLVRCVAYF